MTKYKDDQHPWTHMIEEDFGSKIPKIYGIFNSFEPTLYIKDPDMLNEISTTKNKYFDKHPALKNIFAPLIKNSIIFDESNQLWATKRKTLSAAFYKEKLLKMIVLIKRELKKSLDMWKEKYVDTGKEMNIVQEMSDIFARIILSCAFGEDISEEKIMIETNGKIEYQPLSTAFRNVFQALLYRWVSLQIVLFPESHEYYLT